MAIPIFQDTCELIPRLKIKLFQGTLLQREQPFYMGYVYIGHHSPMGQVAFAFGAFLGQNMTLVSVFPFDASTSGQLEAFFCAGIRFHFRHLCLTVLKITFSFLAK
jgi:hypothetical protein